jgi:hypothetical protein
MSDIFLKFWPVDDVTIDKTALIEKRLIEAAVLSEKIEFLGNPAFSAGANIDNFISGYSQMLGYRKMAIAIKEESYATLFGNPGGEFNDEGMKSINRKNMLEIVNVEDGLSSWNTFCELLEDITGDKYVGDWEFL